MFANKHYRNFVSIYPDEKEDFELLLSKLDPEWHPPKKKYKESVPKNSDDDSSTIDDQYLKLIAHLSSIGMTFQQMEKALAYMK